MTFRRESRAGASRGTRYYLANVGRVMGKTIDLEVDPPPDWPIEAVVGNPAKKAIATYCRLRVPEVWAATRPGCESWCRGRRPYASRRPARPSRS